jgi:hypothetical protein
MTVLSAHEVLDMLLFRSCSKISSSFSPLRKVGAGARSLQIRRRESAYPSARCVSIQCDRRVFADGLTVICLAASVVGSRWSLEKEERLRSKVRNVDISRPGAVWGCRCGSAASFR